MALSVITVPTLSADITNLENEIGLINFNRLTDNAAAVDNLVKGFSDAFVDQTGIDTSASTIAYNETPNTYVGPKQFALVDKGNVPTDWAGDTSNWTFSAFGGTGLQSADNLGGNVRSAVYWNSNDGTSSGNIIQFKLNNTSSIGGLVGWYEKTSQSHIGTTGNAWGAGMFSNSSGHWSNGDPSTGVNGGAIYWSNTDAYAINPGASSWSSAVTVSASDYFNIIRESDNSITVKINGTTNSTFTNYLNKSLTSDWRVVVNASLEGADLDLDYIKINAPGNNSEAGTLISTAHTAVTTPTTVKLIVIGQENFTQTLNSDTVFAVSRDNGSTYTNLTMSNVGRYNSSGVNIYSGSVDISGQPSGTSLRIKITTAAGKRFTIHGYSLLYR